MRSIYKLLDFIADLFFPNRCPVCDGYIKYDEYICEKCEKELEYADDSYCKRCGQLKCICSSETIYYDAAFSFIYYDGAGKKGIISLKRAKATGFAGLFAEKAVKLLKENDLLSDIDIITSVPVSKRKMRETAYNHAHMFAKMIHRNCDIPVSGKLLSKTDESLVQHELSAEERKQRAAKAYSFTGKEQSVKGKTVLLCDDIITTGSTLNYCSKALKEAGADRVICCTIAMTKFE